MSRKLNVAVIGATGLVGEALLQVLAERKFPVAELHLLASSESAGKRIEFNGKGIRVVPEKDFDFSAVELAFLAVPAVEAAAVAARVVDAGAVVIDLSGAFVADPSVIKVVPEVNPEALEDYRETGIVASPSPAAIQLASVLAVLREAGGLMQAQATVLSPVSAEGRSGVEELAGQTARLLNAQEIENKLFPAQIAFNAHPAVGPLLDSGASHDELRVALETLSVLGERALPLTVTSVRLPVFFGTSVVLHAQTLQPVEAASLQALLADRPGLQLVGDTGQPWASALGDAVGEDAVYISRIRQEPTLQGGISLVAVTDNLRKGAAINGVQIAELLLKHHL